MVAGLKPDSASLGYQLSGRSLKSICCVSVQKGKNKERPYLLPFHNALMPPIDYFSQLYLTNQSSSSLYLSKWAEARDWQSNINWTKLSCSLNGLRRNTQRTEITNTPSPALTQHTHKCIIMSRIEGIIWRYIIF